MNKVQRKITDAKRAQALKTLLSLHRTHQGTAPSLKIDALKSLSSETNFKPKELIAYHRLLLFLEAFPDNPKSYALTRASLARIKALAQKVSKKWGAKTLYDSGMPGTSTLVGLSLAALRLIWERDPSSLKIDFTKLGRNEQFQALLRDLVQSPMSDGILSTNFSNDEIYKLSGTDGSVDWLLSAFLVGGAPNQFTEHCFEKFDIWAKWQLGANGSSLTQARFPKRPIVYSTGKLALIADLKSHLSRAIPKEAKLSSVRRKKLIDVARTVLFIQGRETDAVDYTSRYDTRLFQLGSGVDILLLGTTPGRRRFLESFVGFVAAKNGVPCAYGGAWILAGRADIGINIFDWLRGGESALIFSEILRVYTQCFSVARFEVEPYQFGEGNSEGLASGAFWFYWKLGFRSIEPKLNRIAKVEHRKFLANRQYKTPPTVLKKLLGAKLQFESGKKHLPLSVQPLGVASLAHIGSRYKGNLCAARSKASLRVSKLLGIRSFSGWSNDEREAFTRLSVLFEALPGIATWTKSERSELKKLMKAKGAASERNYILLLSKHRRLISSLRALAKKYE